MAGKQSDTPKGPPSPRDILLKVLNNRKQDVGLHLTTIKRWFGTGSPMLDYCLRPQAPPDQRGLPEGKWIELYGPKHGGKSALAARIGAHMQRAYGAHVAWFLGEYGVETSFLQLCGLNLDPDYFSIACPFSLESLFMCLEGIVEAFHDGQRPFCMVVDSFSGLLAADFTMDEKSMKDGASRGAEAKAMHRGFRHGHLYYMNGAPIVAIGIRHQTSNPDARFGPQDIRTHGSALDFHSWIQIKMGRKDFEENMGGKAAGSWLTAKVVKNKVGPLYGEVSMPFFADHGWDIGAEQIMFLVSRNALPVGKGAGRYDVAGRNLLKQDLIQGYYGDQAIRNEIDQLVMMAMESGIKGAPNVKPNTFSQTPGAATPVLTVPIPGAAFPSPLDGLLR